MNKDRYANHTYYTGGMLQHHTALNTRIYSLERAIMNKKNKSSPRKHYATRSHHSADLPNPLLRHVQFALVPVDIRVQDTQHLVL